jgi:hypothetical protein
MAWDSRRSGGDKSPLDQIRRVDWPHGTGTIFAQRQSSTRGSGRLGAFATAYAVLTGLVYFVQLTLVAPHVARGQVQKYVHSPGSEVTLTVAGVG